MTRGKGSAWAEPDHVEHREEIERAARRIDPTDAVAEIAAHTGEVVTRSGSDMMPA